MNIEERLEELNIVLPSPAKPPAGTRINFLAARKSGNQLYMSGNGPIQDGKPAFVGKLGSDLTVDEGYQAARLTALNIMAAIQQELGDLNRVTAWIKALGFINSAPGFHDQPAVLNGFSDLIVEIFGPDRGAHARSAVGIAELPWNMSVEIEVIVEFE